MLFLFREITFCRCGRPARNGSRECRTCYEDTLRRLWREESRHESSLRTPAPLRIVQPAIRRLYAISEEDAERGVEVGPIETRCTSGLPA